jgi:AraC-like DNA-binding protein
LAHLAVLQPDARAAARLNAALADQHVLIDCPCVNSLWETILAGPVDGCVVDIYHPTGALSLTDLQRLRRRQPPLAIVVYSDFATRELDLFELGRLKIDGVILTGTTDQPAETRRAVAGALAAAAAMGVTGALHGQLHPLGIECLRWAIEHAEEAPTVEQLADALALGPAALTRELHERRLPTASRLLLWGRLFRAARLLDDPDGSVERTAFRLGYSSASALGRAFRREIGFTTRELRSRDPLACALDGFLRREIQAHLKEN